MAKESTHRAEELKNLGWSAEEISRYAELWEYRQRWGAINLEREDRQFLRKAESSLPKISTGKASIKKPIKDKSYYKWVLFFLEAMNKAEITFGLNDDERGVWPLLLEEELRALEYYQPVLGLPDTIKAKKLDTFREQKALEARKIASETGKCMEFDFQSPLSNSGSIDTSKFRPLRDPKSSDINSYPILSGSELKVFRLKARSAIVMLIKDTLPSLADSEKPEPPEEWVQD